MDSIIPSIQHPWDRRDAWLSNILDCQTLPKFHSQPSENVHFLVFYISSKKELAISIIIDSVISIPPECITVNHLYNTLSNCANLGCFNVCSLKRHFTLSTDATVFFISQTADNPMLYQATTTLWLLPLSSLLIISSY